MKPILIVTLNPAIDKTVIIDKFLFGKDCRAQKVVNTAGGKGINVARALQFLGMPCCCSGFLGGVNGRFIAAELDREGIKHDFFQITSNTRINLTVFDKFSNKTTRIIEPAPQITSREISLFLKKYVFLVKKASFVVISGSGLGYTQLSPRLIKIADKYSISAALDTSGKELDAGFDSRPFLLKVNLSEAQELLGRKLFSNLEIKKGLIDIFNRGVKIAAITMGSKGALLFDGKEMIYANTKKVDVKTTVGCGDAFLAGLVFSFLRGDSFSDCAKLAAVCGASAAKSFIPGKISIK